MNAKTTRRLFAIHRVTGAIVALNCFVLSITGVVLVFHAEIDAALAGEHDTGSEGPRRPFEELVSAAQAVRPRDVPMFIYFEEGKPKTALVGMAPAGTKELAKAASVKIDSRTAQPRGVREADEGGFVAFVLKLHAELFLGFGGKLLVGAIGLALLVSLVSGFIVYAPAIRRFWFGMLRTGGRRSLLLADLHKLLGATLAGWFFVVVLTGTLLTLGSFVVQLYQMTALAEMTAAYKNKPPSSRRAPFRDVVAHARDAFPGHDVEFITFPGTDFSGDHHFAAFARAPSGLARKIVKLVLVDAETGVVTAARELPWFVKALLVSQPLHFGDYGGLPLKLLWAVLGVGSAGLSATGLYVFVARRRGRRRGTAELAGPLAAAESAEVARAS